MIIAKLHRNLCSYSHQITSISFFSILTAVKQDLRFLKNHQIKINLIQKTVSRQGLIHMNQWLYVMVNPYKAP